ncbi:MAG: hypothetical protein QNJ40_13535 [Xanthomonadales bacterium]|nr:hypothetical protein [Xanthomonadales bacterium]
MIRIFTLLMLTGSLSCYGKENGHRELEPLGRGPHAVGSTNMAVAAEFRDLGDDAMHDILLGKRDPEGRYRFITEVLQHPESAWIVEAPVPNQPAVYGPTAGTSLPVAAFVTWPARADQETSPYDFPYHGGQYGRFEDMLAPGESPVFADPEKKYPLIVLAHGNDAHGIFDIGHAQDLSRHGYIVAVPIYGDDRTRVAGLDNDHVAFLRPLLTRALVDSLLESRTFGPHIDADNIGVSGHSFGGFTALAAAGGRFQGHSATAVDPRVKAAVLAAPWVGHKRLIWDHFAFGRNNVELNRVTTPVLCAFGTADTVTRSDFILPAMQQLSGPTYVVELVDQTHVFEGGSWEDRNAWELLFFNAYLKQDADALASLKIGRSMNGGGVDLQLFDYQKLPGNAQSETQHAGEFQP